MAAEPAKRNADHAEVGVGEGGVCKAEVAQHRQQPHWQEGDEDAVQEGAHHRAEAAADGVAEYACGRAAEEVRHHAGQNQHPVQFAEDKEADEATGETIAVELRYFAAAAEASGRTEERLELPAGTTLAALRERLAGRGLEVARVIGVSSCLVNALSTPADSLTPLADGDRIDVLPPFAGG